jgi:hypothetical protein
MNLTVTRFVLVSVIALAIGLVAASSAANAQFVCGGSGTGAEPQAGGGSSGNAGSVACGLGVTAPSSNSVALGTALPFSSVTASGFESLAVGTGDFVGTIASGTRSVAIGSDTRALATGAVAIGGSATVGGSGGVAIGPSASAGTGLLSVAVGDLAFINPLNNNSTAVGGHSFINIGANTTVLGANAGTGFSASSSNAVAVGESALASADNATAVGQGSHATALGATALGQASVAAFSNSAAIGSGVTTTRANQVAVGTAANTYTLAGVTSAASLAAQTGPTKVVTTDAFGNLAAASFTPQDISTLQSNVGVLQQNVAVLQTQMRQAFEGTAIAIALGGASLPADKRFAISTNWGNFRGQNAVGVAAQYRITDYAVANLGVGGGFAQGGIGSRAGVTFAW